MLCTACAYLFHCPQGACVHLSANVDLVVMQLFRRFPPRPAIHIMFDQQRPQRRILHLSRGTDNLGLNQCKPFLLSLYLLG